MKIFAKIAHAIFLRNGWLDLVMDDLAANFHGRFFMLVLTANVALATFAWSLLSIAILIGIFPAFQPEWLTVVGAFSILLAPAEMHLHRNAMERIGLI